MGLLDFLFGGGEPDRPNFQPMQWPKKRPTETHPLGAQHISDDGAFGQHVVGESRYQHILEEICGGRTAEGADFLTTATLVPEPDNPYDANAVRVDVDGVAVGYLDRPTAKRYHETHSGSVICPAVVRGGWDRGEDDRGSFGVWLDARF